MKKVWSKKDIEVVIKEISEKMGLDATKIPIEISSKMKRRKGQFMFVCIKTPKSIHPLKFKFSNILLDGNYEEDVVREVIIHEYVHFYTNTINKKNCYHDYRFKLNCRKAGISDSTYFTAGGVGYKYKIVCSKCGRKCYRYKLKYDMKTYLKRFKCQCGGTLEVIKLDSNGYSENKIEVNKEGKKALEEFLPVDVEHNQLSLFS
ncbi:SprT-like domain-containing protein [Clostridium perfringens]|uniref:SprT-like domain-containing protein n=1 Tax=Clostridium perfringens TaxID=1502 RepID=UPI003D340052